jgi:hypothetical protein
MVSQCMPTMSTLYFGPFNPFYYSPLLLNLPPPIFNSFQYTSPYLLPSHLMLHYWCSIIHFSFPSFPKFHCYKYVLHLSLYMITCVFVNVFIFRSILHIWEKTCSLSIFEPGLLYITWCPPISSIYLQTTSHFLWLSNTLLCIYHIF